MAPIYMGWIPIFLELRRTRPWCIHSVRWGRVCLRRTARSDAYPIAFNPLETVRTGLACPELAEGASAQHPINRSRRALPPAPRGLPWACRYYPAILGFRFPPPAGAPVGALRPQEVAVLHATRRSGAEHGAAHLSAGDRTNSADPQPRCGAYVRISANVPDLFGAS